MNITTAAARKPRIWSRAWAVPLSIAVAVLIVTVALFAVVGAGGFSAFMPALGSLVR